MLPPRKREDPPFQRLAVVIYDSDTAYAGILTTVMVRPIISVRKRPHVSIYATKHANALVDASFHSAPKKRAMHFSQLCAGGFYSIPKTMHENHLNFFLKGMFELCK